jgi:ABC-2 type transport system permease protein
MSKIFIVATREIREKLSSIWFWLGSLLIPLGMILLTLVSVFIAVNATVSDTKLRVLAVLDNSNVVFEKLKSDNRFQFEKVEGTLENAKKQALSTNKNGLVYIPKIESNSNNPDLNQVFQNIEFYQNDSNFMVQASVEQRLNTAILELKSEKYNLSPEIVTELNKPITLKTQNLSTNQDKQQVSSVVARGIGAGIGLSLYILIFIYGSILMTSVLEEKTNRVFENILVSIDTFSLMMGKILGNTATILIQILLFSVSAVVSNIVVFAGLLWFLKDGFGDISGSEIRQILDSVDLIKLYSSLNLGINFNAIIIFSLIYLIFGLLIYNSWFVAAASSSNNITEASNSGLTFLISTPLILVVLFGQQILADPTGFLATFLSIFPLTSPIVMPALIAYNPPFWQILLSLIFSVVGFFGSVWVASKIYKIGVLTYGQKLTLKKILASL